MLFKYKDDMPIVSIEVSGNRGRNEFDAPIDYAASLSVVPYEAGEELGLEFEGFAPTATGGGVIGMPVYRAKAKAFGKDFDLRVGALQLPKESTIRALVGRNILDSFRICLDGKRKEMEVSDPQGPARSAEGTVMR